MPKLVIADSFSHMGGEEMLRAGHKQELDSVVRALTNAEIPKQSKRSHEKTKLGKLVWSGKDFNPAIESCLDGDGWKKIHLPLEEGSIECDFFRARVVVEVQFGKYFSVDTDFSKFEILHAKDKIDVAIEIVPSSGLLRKMCTGPPSFVQVRSRIKAKGRNNPAVPVLLFGVDVNGS